MVQHKLMTPLFHNGSFNRDGKKMRAVFDREITARGETYRIWRKAGDPDIEHPHSENDKYLMYVELNNYLIPLYITYAAFVMRCGCHAALDKLYGEKTERELYFQKLKEAGGGKRISEALEAENEAIERCGEEPENQVAYIQRYLDTQERIYLQSKNNNGNSAPSFIGAAILNDLEKCQELAEIYGKKKEKEALERELEEEKAYCEEQNKRTGEAIKAAIEIIKNGGILENKQITFYQKKYETKSYSIVNYLMRMYKVNVPIRTQGWINKRLSAVVIEQGKCEGIYLKDRKFKSSQIFFDCMFELIQAVKE